MGGRCGTHVELRNAYELLVTESQGKRPLGRSGCKWEENITVDLKIMVGGCKLDSTGSGWGPVVGFCEHGDEPLCVIKVGSFLTSCVIVNHS
jgi:hypothetical protein